VQAIKNPNSVLANVPQEEFTSRYSDPKSPAARGSLISLVSGGKLVPNPQSRGLIGGLVSVTKQAIRGEQQGSGWQNVNRGAPQRETIVHKQIKKATKILRSNVLYLMVVNMPSEADMNAARASIGK